MHTTTRTEAAKAFALLSCVLSLGSALFAYRSTIAPTNSEAIDALSLATFLAIVAALFVFSAIVTLPPRQR